ncbi:hypothetical protein KGA66_21670 [Actinocrinis puniceicyclus]|uniref:Uncharacterized protein n=1 Tax=Actinocrinis puniceicyclus TaxID=977794 RepID=A0A8J7WS32_9ACTN|nr:hypothetical protein [Actinocrinis puniceicyclus]MBS2965675.1 hypothetical protein [Actinocrinis puniceicyclus]
MAALVVFALATGALSLLTAKTAVAFGVLIGGWLLLFAARTLLARTLPARTLPARKAARHG